jgi:hypothetical protein
MKYINYTLAAILGSLGNFSNAVIDKFKPKDTRVSKNKKRHAGTKSKYRFVSRASNGYGNFLELHTNKMSTQKIKAEGLSKYARHHFGIPEKL